MWTLADRMLRALVPELQASADSCHYVGSGCGEPCWIGSFQGYVWTDNYLCTDDQGFQYIMSVPQACGMIC